ncbi:MAG: fused MFS/spermidine synthase [Pirellulales bacterium]
MFPRALVTALFALTTFTSAFLLFQVQPLLSKRLLPWFGGSPAVWTTCVLFFQSLLFAGYAYAHASEHWLPRRVQTAVHIALLTAALLLLPILPGDPWKPAGDSEPIAGILTILGASVGLAYFLLSSTGPLVSAWFSRVFPQRSPYRLYALSNFGSLLALVSYPFVFEPAFSLAEQADYWAWGYRLFALLSAASAAAVLVLGRTESGASVAERAVGDSPATAAPRRWQRAAWIALPAFASVAFLATTNFVCQDVAVVPFLWVAPLSLYLLSFIICFDHERWYQRRFFAGTFLLLVAFGPFLYALDLSYEYVYELSLFFGGMFCVCMMCHGELVRLRPPPRHLTAFYLCIAAGGALGGVFVSVIAPLVFSTHYEWPLAAIGSVFMALALLGGNELRQWLIERRRLVLPIAAVATIVALSVAKQFVLGDQRLIWQGRSFYGVVTVTESRDEPEKRHRLIRNGRITHGMQFTAPSKRRLPTSYYGPESGMGQTLAYFETREGVRVGDVGLGAGTLATYARKGDLYRFYELNPEVIDLAYEHFTFLADCLGEVAIVPGDGRLSLERETSHDFDVLVLDAFSGDAIPTHLLTTEAFETYERHLSPDGALCIHVSNRYLDLTGVVRRLAERHGFDVVHVDQPEDDRESDGIYSSEWMVLSKNRALLATIDQHVVEAPAGQMDAPLWTDAQTDLFSILR